MLVTTLIVTREHLIRGNMTRGNVIHGNVTWAKMFSGRCVFEEMVYGEKIRGEMNCTISIFSTLKASSQFVVWQPYEICKLDQKYERQTDRNILCF
jgi:hypothetical protein